MHVLIVDPSRTVRRIIQDLVVGWGHSAAGFCTAEEALAELAGNDDARALITSVELAGSSGLELCKSARKQTGARPLYILLMSSSDQRDKLIAALESGADDFISKPLSSEELKARLRVADRVTSMQAALARQAITDPLTEAMNRRGFFEHASKAWNKVTEGRRLSALILDIDRFKSINDRYGHGTGDSVLIAIAHQARDLGFSLGRLGGEEFAALLESSLDDGFHWAEELRRAIECLAIQAEGHAIAVTCSIGVAETEPGDTIDSVLRRADMALYEAKRQGRNCVVAADTYRLSDEHQKWRGTARVACRRDRIVESA